MKKTTLLFILLFTVPLLSLQAAEIEPQGTPLRKLQRGALDIALSPIEISNELAKEKTHDTFPPSWVLGFARGSFFMLGRIAAGACEIVTFPFPIPAGYAPILEPEFAWQHLEQTPPAGEKQ